VLGTAHDRDISSHERHQPACRCRGPSLQHSWPVVVGGSRVGFTLIAIR